MFLKYSLINSNLKNSLTFDAILLVLISVIIGFMSADFDSLLSPSIPGGLPLFPSISFLLSFVTDRSGEPPGEVAWDALTFLGGEQETFFASGNFPPENKQSMRSRHPKFPLSDLNSPSALNSTFFLLFKNVKWFCKKTHHYL